MDRRDFLKWSAVVLTFGPFMVGSTPDGADPYSREFFAQRVGHWFEAGRAYFLQLIAVEAGPASTQFDQFTLVFRVDARDALADGTWSLRAESGETVDVFLQRRANSVADARYTASFAVTRPLSIASCA